jgi:hypothetical protein
MGRDSLALFIPTHSHGNYLGSHGYYINPFPGQYPNNYYILPSHTSYRLNTNVTLGTKLPTHEALGDINKPYSNCSTPVILVSKVHILLTT